jgi:hypothetical protein
MVGLCLGDAISIDAAIFADNRYDTWAEMFVAWSKWEKHVAGLSEGRRYD